MGIEDIIYSEITKARNRKKAQKERKESALRAVESALKAFLKRKEIITRVQNPKQTARFIENAEKLYDDLELILIELDDLLSPELLDETTQLTSVMRSILDGPEKNSVGNRDWANNFTDTIEKMGKEILKKIDFR